MTKEINWANFKGQSENEVEQELLNKWGGLPDEWMDPLFRDLVTNSPGQAAHDAHQSFASLTYGPTLDDSIRSTKINQPRRNKANPGHQKQTPVS